MIFEINTLDEFKEKVEALNLKVVTFSHFDAVKAVATNGVITITHVIEDEEQQATFDTYFKNINEEVVTKTVVEPFALKGKNHFRGTGIKEEVPAGTTVAINFSIPYNTCCYNGIEILNGAYADNVQLKILDNAVGSFSTVPDAVLDQFGINWNMKKELIQILPYEATLYKSMVLSVEYTNNTSENKTIYVNHYLHEVE